LGDNAVPSMKLGFNYAWAFEQYGQNFGPVFRPLPPPDGLPTWKNTLPRNLGQIKRLGMSIVRFFILQNGLNYGSVRVDPTGRILNIGLPIPAVPLQLGKKTEFIFDPPKALHPLFGQHFRLMLENFRDQRMQVIPSLVDFKMLALPPNIFDSSSGGGRTDIAVNDAKRKLFLDTVLEPLLDISVEFKDEIFAWEIMNEPSWLTRRFAPPVGNFGTEEPVMTEAQLTTFLREGLDRIERRNEFKNKSTVGHRFVGDLNKFPTGALPQYHYYGKTAPLLGGDPSNIPPRTQAKNAFIGEFSPEFAANKLYLNALNFEQGAPWPDCKGSDIRDTVVERLKILTRQDYQLALVWPDKGDRAGTDDVKLSGEAKASIRAFTGAP
jgi:hypothetical protein